MDASGSHTRSPRSSRRAGKLWYISQQKTLLALTSFWAWGQQLNRCTEVNTNSKSSATAQLHHRLLVQPTGVHLSPLDLVGRQTLHLWLLTVLVQVQQRQINHGNLICPCNGCQQLRHDYDGNSNVSRSWTRSNNLPIQSFDHIDKIYNTRWKRKI